jgi:hypothetical protein
LASQRQHQAGGLDAPDGHSPRNHQRRLLVVYPAIGNRSYGEFASRLCEAASVLGLDATLISASDLVNCEASRIEGTTAFVVNPDECALSGRAALARLNRADFRGAVVAECVETEWYRNQFALGIEFDSVIDVGFVDQSSIHPFRKMPYRFLFNAPLPRERALIASRKGPSHRRLSWSLVATCTIERVRLAKDLLLAFGPQGFLFLPADRPVWPGEVTLTPDGLRRVLEETMLYVWCSHHDFPYYDSFRFLDAVLCGSVPCTIDKMSSPIPGGVPHVYPTVQALEDELTKRSGEELFEENRTYALAHGTLDDHLMGLLRDV